jgi:predicted heme/steroid binding protein
MPFKLEDEFWVAHVVPVLHYTMGGLQITPEAEVQKASGGAAIPGLFAAGEVTGGVHGNNRLGGSSLLDCVVYGRVSGSSAARYLFQQSLRAVTSGGATSTAGRRIERITGQLGAGESVISASVSQAGVTTRVDVEPSTKRLTLEVSWDDGKSPVGPASVSVSGGTSSSSSAAAPVAAAAAAPVEEKKAAAPVLKEYTLADVAKHNTDKDCWVVVNGQVLDVTKFLPKHPGGKPAIMLYAGKDATAEFNMLHKSDVVEKYAPDTVIGTLAGGSPSH